MRLGFKFIFSSLKSLDLLTMKKLDNRVNIIPIIAKADIVSKSELNKFKIQVTNTLHFLQKNLSPKQLHSF